MNTMIIVDAHLDLAYNAVRGRPVLLAASQQPADEQGTPSVGLADLVRGGASLICGTLFCEPFSDTAADGYRDSASAAQQMQRQLDWYQDQFQAGRMVPVQNREDVRRLVERWETEASQRARKKDYAAELLQLGFPQPPRPPDPLPCIILMEGADAIGSPAEVARWFAAGVRMVGLAWRQSRYAGGTGHPGPLTAEGRKLAAALDAMGMIHDVSHLAEQSFWELLDITGGGVAASHSNCQAIVPGDRQLSDAMIRALGKRAGMIGINFYDRFLLPPSARSERATLEHVVAHVRHICDVLGDAGHVGLGTDMDGGFGREHLPRQIESWADVSRLADSLAAAGLSDQDIHGIMGGNWIEFFRANLP